MKKVKVILRNLSSMGLLSMNNNNIELLDQEEKKYFNTILWIIAVMLVSNSKEGCIHLYKDLISDYQFIEQETIKSIAYEKARVNGLIENLNDNLIWTSFYTENYIGNYDNKSNWNVVSKESKVNPRDILNNSYTNAISILNYLDTEKFSQKKIEDKLLLTSMMIQHNDVSFNYFKELFFNEKCSFVAKKKITESIHFTTNKHLGFNLKHLDLIVSLKSDLNLNKHSFLLKSINDFNYQVKRIKDEEKKVYDIASCIFNSYGVGLKLMDLVDEKNFTNSYDINVLTELEKNISFLKNILEDDDIVFDTDNVFRVDVPLKKINIKNLKEGRSTIDEEFLGKIMLCLSIPENTVFTNNIEKTSSTIFVAYPKEVKEEQKELYTNEFIKLVYKLLLNPSLVFNNDNIGINLKSVKVLSDEILINTLVDKIENKKINIKKF